MKYNININKPQEEKVKEEDNEIQNKLTLAKLTYGKIRKLTQNMFITDYDGTTRQTIFNLNNGNKIQERLVEKVYDDDQRPLYTYYDGIITCKHIIILPPQQLLSNYDYVIYDIYCNFLYATEVNSHQIIEFDEIETIDNKVLIQLTARYSNRIDNNITYTILEYNLVTHTLDNIYNNISLISRFKNILDNDTVTIELQNNTKVTFSIKPYSGNKEDW